MKKLSKIIILSMVVMSFFMVSGYTLAATKTITPPSILPSEDTNIGGYGDECIGLATMIQTGNIHLRNLPCFVKYITQTLIAIGGSLAVVFVMIGGYRYVIGPDEKKDEAKKTITYALIGLAVSLLAWVIVDIVLQVATE